MTTDIIQNLLYPPVLIWTKYHLKLKTAAWILFFPLNSKAVLLLGMALLHSNEPSNPIHIVKAFVKTDGKYIMQCHKTAVTLNNYVYTETIHL